MSELLAPDDTRDTLRKYGGLLLALAALMIFLRKGSGPDQWGDFAMFLLLAVPAVFLYGLGVFTDRASGGLRPWQAVYSVLGLIFVPLALLQFIELVNGSPSALNTFWVFGAAAGFAFYAGAIKGIRWHLLIGSIFAIVSWSALWDKILGDEGIAGHFGTYRGLLGILAILLLALALYVWRQNNPAQVEGTALVDVEPGLTKASEVITGAGIAAVLACSLGISSAANFFGPFGLTQITVIETAPVWDILLLVISLGLVGIGATIGTRGPVYIGGIGLFLFLLIAGLDLNEGAGANPGKFGGWPIVLLIAGALALALSFVRGSSLGTAPRDSIKNLGGK